MRNVSPIIDRRVAQVVDTMLESEGDVRLSLTALSQELGINQRTLGRRFKAQTGSTFRSMLKKLRVDAAAAKLENHELSVKELAYSLGYSATSNFERDFRDVYGTSPGAHRRQFKGSTAKSIHWIAAGFGFLLWARLTATSNM